MLVPSGDNTTLLEQLLSAEKALLERDLPPPAALEAYRSNTCPDCFIDYYDKFLSLAKRRGEGFHGYAPLSWQDIDSWCRLQNHAPSPLFLDVIDLLDNIWLRVYRKKNKPKK